MSNSVTNTLHFGYHPPLHLRKTPRPSPCYWPRGFTKTHIYGLHDTLLHNTGFEFPVSIYNTYPLIVLCTPSFQKQSQKSLVMLIILVCELFNCRSYSQIFYKLFQTELFINFSYINSFSVLPLQVRDKQTVVLQLPVDLCS